MQFIYIFIYIYISLIVSYQKLGIIVRYFLWRIQIVSQIKLCSYTTTKRGWFDLGKVFRVPRNALRYIWCDLYNDEVVTVFAHSIICSFCHIVIACANVYLRTKIRYICITYSIDALLMDTFLCNSSKKSFNLWVWQMWKRCRHSLKIMWYKPKYTEWIRLTIIGIKEKEYYASNQVLLFKKWCQPYRMIFLTKNRFSAW